jgi:hypothetical protein
MSKLLKKPGHRKATLFFLLMLLFFFLFFKKKATTAQLNIKYIYGTYFKALYLGSEDIYFKQLKVIKTFSPQMLGAYSWLLFSPCGDQFPLSKSSVKQT